MSTPAQTTATPRTERNRWIRRFRDADADVPVLVCLPHAGGSAGYFLPFARSLSPRVEVLAVQYPGRQERRAEPCLEDIGELADQVVRHLEPWLNRPVALFGHSMGAMIGYEAARRIERDGGRLLGLFASGRRAPSDAVSEHHPADDEGLIAELRGLAGTSDGVLSEPDLLALVLPALRGDYRAVEAYQYRPGPSLRCPITVLVGDRDPVTSLEQARVWERHTETRCQIEVFPGGHFYLEAHRDATLGVVRRRLELWSAAA